MCLQSYYGMTRTNSEDLENYKFIQKYFYVGKMMKAKKSRSIKNVGFR